MHTPFVRFAACIRYVQCTMNINCTSRKIVYSFIFYLFVSVCLRSLSLLLFYLANVVLQTFETQSVEELKKKTTELAAPCDPLIFGHDADFSLNFFLLTASAFNSHFHITSKML